MRALAQQVPLEDTATRHSTLERERAAEALTAVTALIDPSFLQEMGWDSERFLLFPPEGHRLLIRPVCVRPKAARPPLLVRGGSAGRVGGGSMSSGLSPEESRRHYPLRPGADGEGPANVQSVVATESGPLRRLVSASDISINNRPSACHEPSFSCIR